MNQALKKLFSLLTTHEKKLLATLLILSGIISGIEIISLSALMAFVSLAIHLDHIEQNPYIGWLYRAITPATPQKFMVILGAGLIVFYLIRCSLNLVAMYAISHFSFQRYFRFSTTAFKYFLHRSYTDFVAQNSAQFQQIIFFHPAHTAQLLLAILCAMAEFLTILGIYGLLLWANWKMTLVITLVLGIACAFVLKIFSFFVAKAGADAHKHNIGALKIFNESVGNFKIIKLLSNYTTFSDRMNDESAGYAHALTTYNALQQAPRLVLETIGFTTIIGLVMFVVTRYAHFETIIPILSLYAFAFYRLLPSINKILAGLNQTTFSQKSVLELEAFYTSKTEQLGTQPITFTNNIDIKNLSFYYQPEKPILHNISCTIKKGQKVAFVGASGSGKSTLVDVLMGMYPPKQEAIFIDGVAINDSNRACWRQKIGYIPQSIYLFDGTVKDNVVFGRPYDQDRLYKALENAHILAFLMSQKGLDTHVGEGGISLSGGQKQRIAIARALYAQPEILVLDEATSALDHETESLIMQEIYALSGSITLIVIAHRITTIARCDVIFEICNGGIQEILYSTLATTATTAQGDWGVSQANEHTPSTSNNQ